MEITEQILNKLLLLKDRPKMVIPVVSIDYFTLKIFILGYIDGLSSSLNRELNKEITMWFNKRINEQYSISWIDIIPHYYKNKSDAELKEILISSTEEYFRENPLG